MKGFLAVIISLALVSMAAAQQPAAGANTYTLEQLESIALTSNPDLLAAAARINVVQARVPQAGALEDPMLQARSWGIPLREPWNANQAQNMLMFSQSLPGPGKRDLANKIARRDVAVTRDDLEALKRDVLLQVRKAYFDLLRNRDELGLHDRQVALARQAFEAAKVKYSVGRVPQQDMLKAQLLLTRLAEHLVMLDERGAMARAQLNTLLGRDPSTALEVSGDYRLVRSVPELADLQRIAIENRPELAALRETLQQSNDKLALARKAYTPDFQVGGGYMLGPSGMQFRNGYMAEFSMTLPWLNKRKHDSEIQEAAAETTVRKAELESKRNQVRQELQESLIRVRSAQRLVELYRTTLQPQVDTALKSTAAAYQSDRTDFLNVVDSQNMALEVRSAYFNALADLDARLSELERATGAPLDRSLTEPGEKQ